MRAALFLHFTFINKKENSIIFPIDRKEEIWYILSREMKVLRHWKVT